MEYIRNPKLRGEANRLKIYEFFVANPCHTNAAAAQALDLSEPTVSKHTQAIRDGWRPGAPPEPLPVPEFDRIGDDSLIQVLIYLSAHDCSPSVLGAYQAEAERRGLSLEVKK